MKFFILVLSAALTSFAVANSPTKSTTAAASDDWKVISETQDCPRKVQIKAKAGEKYVIAVEGKSEYKLLAANGTAFSADSMNAVEYSTEKTAKSTDQNTLSFIQPSYVENRPAKLLFSQNGQSDRCPLVAK